MADLCQDRKCCSLVTSVRRHCGNYVNNRRPWHRTRAMCADAQMRQTDSATILTRRKWVIRDGLRNCIRSGKGY